MEIRLNKLLSDSGRFSRREADRVIESGRVFVNGKRAQVGDKVLPHDKVMVDGQRIETNQERIYIALNKPVGIVCTTDTTERGNVVDFVNYPQRIFNIGRLDKPSEGLLLLTNDGDIVNKILRAANNHEKEYVVHVDKSITQEFIQKMSSGVPILGTMTKKCKVTQEGDKRFRIVLTQGLNRQIRRMCEVLGYEVVRLCRIRIMHITIDKLPVGQWRFFTDSELKQMNELLAGSEGDSKPKQKPPKAPPSARPQKATTSSAPKHSPRGKNGEPKSSRPSSNGRSGRGATVKTSRAPKGHSRGATPKSRRGR